MAFKVGDRVRCIRNDGLKELVGKVGTVVEAGRAIIGIDFDESIGGHGLDGKARGGHGWWLALSSIELVDSNVNVIITIKGKTTTAKMMVGKRCVVKAVAKCSPNDALDPLVGAQIALQRLVEQRGSKFVVNSKMFNDVEVI